MKRIGSLIGLRPEHIDVVLCTHLHVDHSGWNTQWLDGRWRPTFPNARYILSRTEVASAEWLHRERGDPTYAENVLPVIEADRKSTRLNSSHSQQSRMPSSA